MDKTRIKLAIAPIGWTNDDMPDLGRENTFEQCISETALAGFTGTEVGNTYPADARELKKALDLRKLTVCSQWYSTHFITRPLREIEADFREKLKFLKILGARAVNPSEQTRSCQGLGDIGVHAGKAQFSADEWKMVIRGSSALGRIAREEGFKLCMHHHMGTGVQTLEETERFLSGTDPEAVFITYDSGHFFYSGSSPVEALERLVSRVGHVHLKDIRPRVHKCALKEDWPFMKAVREGIFTVPGDGCIDFPALFRILDKAAYQGWMVVEAEQDPAKANPFEYALKARDYIRTHAGL